MRLLQNMKDQELIKLYVVGDERGLKELLDRYKNNVFTAIYVKVKDQFLAEDLFQETFIKVINTVKADRYNDEGKFLPWVLRIAHNVVIDYFRKAKRTPFMISTEGYDIVEAIALDEDNTESKFVKEQMGRDLKKIIQLLPEDQKEVLIMRHFCDMSFKQIAYLTEVSINTALGRMRYALANLRRMIEQHNMSFQF